MSYLTKFGPLETSQIIYYVIGPRSVSDDIEIGPFRTQADANGYISEQFKHIVVGGHIHARSATGLEALKIMEQLEKEENVS